MSVAGFYNPRDNMHVFHLSQRLVTSLEMGRLKLMSKGGVHVEIGAHEFRYRPVYSRHKQFMMYPPIRTLQDDPIRKLFFEIPHIAALGDWSGRPLHWHLADNYFSAPSRDPIAVDRFIDFRVEPIPEV